MNKPLTLGSLFDGSGTFPMMAMLSGIVPVWKSEIEPFPIAVTEKRLPFVKHLATSTASTVQKLSLWILSPLARPVLIFQLQASVRA